MKPLETIRNNRGMTKRIAEALGVFGSAVSQWKQVPATRVLTVSRVTGIPPHELRPDLYPVPEQSRGDA